MKNIYLLLFIITAKLGAQPYNVEKGNTRHRFAQSVFGLELATLPGGESAILNSDGIVPYNLEPQIWPRLHIGGLHFWGHAEFYFNIAFSKPFATDFRDMRYFAYQMEIFGTKIYPWRIEKNKLRPYAGFSPSLVAFRQSVGKVNTGPLYSHTFISLLGGLSYYKKGWQIEAGFSYSTGEKRFAYYLDKNTTFASRLSPYTFWFGIRKVLETTIAMEKPYRNGLTEKRYARLKELKKQNSFFVGVGPSSAFLTAKSDYLVSERPYLGKKSLGSIFPEAVAGYHFAKIRTHVLAVFRMNSSKWTAYGTKAKAQRIAAGFEAHAQLFDYHGFVPYVGISGGYEKLSYDEWENGVKQISADKEKLAAGIVFGWDIVPDKLQPFILRTNLRYFHDLGIDMDNGKKISLDQLEFNFIQFVYYPTRAKWIRYVREEITD